MPFVDPLILINKIYGDFMSFFVSALRSNENSRHTDGLRMRNECKNSIFHGIQMRDHRPIDIPGRAIFHLVAIYFHFWHLLASNTKECFS